MFTAADLVATLALAVSETKLLKSAVDAVLGEIVIAKVAVNGGDVVISAFVVVGIRVLLVEVKVKLAAVLVIGVCAVVV